MSARIPLVLIAVLSLAGSACDRNATAKSDGSTSDVAPYPAAKVSAAAAATVPEWITVTGEVTAHDRSDVVPDTPGKVLEVLVDRGMPVKKGQPLVRLDTRSAALTSKEATANLESLRAQKQVADEECKRSQALFDKQAITRSEWERQQASCTQLAEQVAGAEARVGQAGKALSDGVIRAPFDGVVADKWVSPGEWAGAGGRLITLIDNGGLRVDLQLSESEAARVTLGAPVEVEPVAVKGKTFSGKITRLGAEIDPRTRAMVVEADLPSDPALRSGMFVQARIAIGERTLPAVPKTALLKRGATWRLFAVVGDRLEERVVQVGAETADGRVTITRGIAAEDKVASIAGEENTDGQLVR